MAFGAIFAVETNNEYRTITPEMLKEQMPQSTQLFQPNIENLPKDSYIEFENQAPSGYNSHQNGNYNNASPQSTFANYGYWVRHRDHGGHGGHRDSMNSASMHHNYDPENIGLFDCIFRPSVQKHLKMET